MSVTIIGGPHDGTVIDDPEPGIQAIAIWHFVLFDIEAGGTAVYLLNRDRTTATFDHLRPYGSHEELIRRKQ